MPSFVADSAILDADMAIKLGEITKEDVISTYFPHFLDKLYIASYVFFNEILTPVRVKQQLSKLIGSGFAAIVDPENLDMLDKQLFDHTFSLLQSNRFGNPPSTLDYGELTSLSLAKALGIPVLLSDDKVAHLAAREVLNTGTIHDVQVYGLKDFILWLKNYPQNKRKLAKTLWLRNNQCPATFDQEIWPKSL